MNRVPVHTFVMLAIGVLASGCTRAGSTPVASQFSTESSAELLDWASLSDDERIALLKPEMTLEEVNRLWVGKTLLGQG